MLEGLTEKLQSTFKRLRGKGKLSEKDVNAALREVKMALLEADVNFKVVKDFISILKERAIGAEVLESLTPAQHVVKIVNEELTRLMGGEQSKINIASKPPTIVMLVGLQGAGKTTSAGKLAKLMHKQGRRPLLVAGDIYRPAAIKQLQVLGEQLDIPVFTMGDKHSPVDIAKGALQQAKSINCDMLIIDTAGRLHIDEVLMEELKAVKDHIHPHEILLVVDAMTGQDAVNVAETFNEQLGIDGVILTKLDGDTRGGAALSVRAVTNRPIKFVGMGEKLDALEPFHPERLSSRILGMGDMLSLIEKAQTSFDAKKAQDMEKKIREQSFTLEDFFDQLQQVKQMGPLDQIMGMIPGMNNMKNVPGGEVDEKQLAKIEAVICSMTPHERQQPEIINGSRRRRIALGSGTRVQDVNSLLKQFAQAKKMMKKISDMQKGGKKMGGKFPFF